MQGALPPPLTTTRWTSACICVSQLTGGGSACRASWRGVFRTLRPHSRSCRKHSPCPGLPQRLLTSTEPRRAIRRPTCNGVHLPGWARRGQGGPGRRASAAPPPTPLPWADRGWMTASVWARGPSDQAPLGSPPRAASLPSLERLHVLPELPHSRRPEWSWSPVLLAPGGVRRGQARRSAACGVKADRDGLAGPGAAGRGRLGGAVGCARAPPHGGVCGS